MRFDLKCPADWKLFEEYIKDNVDQAKHYRIDMVNPRNTRTDQQRKSIELYCKLMSKALNDGGFDFSDFSRAIEHNGTTIPWDHDGRLFKEHVWRRVQRAMLDKESTTELNSDEVSRVYDVINRKFIEMTNRGISIQFPNRFHGITAGY